MEKSIFLASIVSLGLLSATICECRMQLMMASTSSDHCAPADERDTTLEQCCLSQAAVIEAGGAIVPAPHTVEIAFSDVIAPIIPNVPQLSEGKIVQKPPGAQSLTHQNCILLI